MSTQFPGLTASDTLAMAPASEFDDGSLLDQLLPLAPSGPDARLGQVQGTTAEAAVPWMSTQLPPPVVSNPRARLSAIQQPIALHDVSSRLDVQLPPPVVAGSNIRQDQLQIATAEAAVVWMSTQLPAPAVPDPLAHPVAVQHPSALHDVSSLMDVQLPPPAVQAVAVGPQVSNSADSPGTIDYDAVAQILAVATKITGMAQAIASAADSVRASIEQMSEIVPPAATLAVSAVLERATTASREAQALEEATAKVPGAVSDLLRGVA
jgi:hypothetical protein